MAGINESGKTGVGLSASELDLVGSEVFIQAVVVEVIHDPSAFLVQGEKVLKAKYPDISDAYLSRAPRNSVIARILNQGTDKAVSRNILCLPFFPPHLCFPVKPGEHVWLVSAAGHGTSPTILFWMCRVHLVLFIRIAS